MPSGKLYAAFVNSSGDFGARPFMSALLKMDAKEGLTYKMMEKSASMNNLLFWTKIVVPEGQTKEMEEVSQVMGEWQDHFTSNFLTKSKGQPLPEAILCPQDGNGSPRIITGAQFIDAAISVGLFAKGTLEKTKGLLPKSLNTTIGTITLSLGKTAGKLTSTPSTSRSPDNPSNAVDGGATPLPGPNSFQTQPGGEFVSDVTDQVKAAFEEVRGEGGSARARDQQGQLSPERVEEEAGEQGSGEVGETVVTDTAKGNNMAEEDKLVEDVLELVQALPPGERQSAIIDCMLTTMHTLQRSVKEQKDMVAAQSRLIVAQDLKLKSFQESAAREIIPGIIPGVEKAMAKIKGDLRSCLEENLDKIITAVKAEGKSAMGPELAGIRSAIATGTTKVADQNKTIQGILTNTMETAHSLSSLRSRGENQGEEAFDIPASLSRIEGHLKSLPGTQLLSSRATVAHIPSLRACPPPDFSTPPPSISKQYTANSAPRNRWDMPPPSSATPPSVPAKEPRPSSAKNLEKELLSTSSAPSLPQEDLFMAQAQAIMNHEGQCPTPSFSKQEIEDKIRELTDKPAKGNKRPRVD